MRIVSFFYLFPNREDDEQDKFIQHPLNYQIVSNTLVKEKLYQSQADEQQKYNNGLDHRTKIRGIYHQVRNNHGIQINKFVIFKEEKISYHTENGSWPSG